MKAPTIIFAALLCALPVLAEEPTVEGLTRKVEALERQVAELKAELSVAKGKAGEGDGSNKVRGEIVVNVLKDGRIRVEDLDLQGGELVTRLKAVSNAFPDAAVRIKGDMDTKYKDVVQAIELCQSAGIWNISFATGKAAPSGGDKPSN